MGGINSGRRMQLWASERNIPIAEEAVVLSIFDLARAGVLEDGRSGLYRWDTSSLWYWTEGSTITLHYTVNGNVNVAQSITIGQISLHWQTYASAKPCFLCPHCGRSVYKLYIAFGETHYRCRVCYHIGYELQTLHYGSLCYRYLSIHKKVISQHKRRTKRTKTR